ncbi:oligosaccharide flippase family protein [Sporosarcina luteola]|uniref:oligosaccharide flippase family protein n=1 Tax=Sporosarcina luteola TaxID=582850 RepID=UPI00203BB558|nr:oligosaccharide flippase family protein [Sporosarcina luteola]MCM3709209.1 oligosaccharide flippase family protein [Sporosarcina luteola]
MNKLKGIIKGNRFLSAFSVLVMGSIGAQLISILVAPLTTRLFTPYEFGIYTLITTAVSLFGPILCLKYDMSIITARNRKDTYALIKLCFFLSVFLSIIFGLLYGFFVFFNHDYTFNERAIFIVGTIFLLMTYGSNNVLLAHNNKKALYKLMSIVTITKSLTTNSILLLAGVLKTGVLGMIGSHLFGSLSGIIRQSADVRGHRNKIKRIKWGFIYNLAKKEKNQPIYNATSTLIITSIYSTINLFIGKVYSPFQLGLYSLSYRILGLPFAIISANISRIYFTTANEEFIELGNYRKTFKQTFLFLVSIVIPIMVLIFFLSPVIFSRIFGEEWREAGIYIQYLTPMFGIKLISESLTTGFIISNKQKYELIIQSILLSTQVFIFFIVVSFNIPIYTFLNMISGLYVMFNSVLLLILFKLSGKNITI